MPQFQPALIRQRAFAYHDRLSRVSRFCEEHLSEKITLARAADVAGLEYTYFSTFFHSAVGVRFGDWLRFLRVRRAQALIRENNQPITTIARQSGFSNLRTFQRAFRRIADMSPREYRREARQGFSAYAMPNSSSTDSFRASSRI